MKKYAVGAVLLLWASVSFAHPVRELSLVRCEQDALASSAQLKQLGAEAQAARSSYESVRSSLYPSLTLDASGSWVSEVPELEFGPIKSKFGDNWGYSVGPTLSYTLFDAGGRGDARESAFSAYNAKLQELEFAKKQVLLQVRQAYFTVQQDLERMYFVNEQLNVARKQLADVNSAYNAGAKSKLDVYMARKQELRAQINISAAQGALGAHLRELFRLAGTDYGINPLYPMDWRLAASKDASKATAFVKADGLTDTVARFTPLAGLAFDQNSPRLAALEHMAQYYEYLADSYKSSLYPRVGLQAGAYWEYPNGPIKEDVFLGRAGVALSVPLFEGSKNRELSKAQRASAEASRYQKRDVQETLEKLFYSSKDRLYSVGVEENLTRKMIEDSAETAKLTYQAYQAGAVTFLEVDNANLGLLESRIGLADLYVEELNRLAVMDSLGGGVL